MLHACELYHFLRSPCNLFLVEWSLPFVLFSYLTQEEDVSEKKREEISQLLETHGMLKSAEARSEVPEEPFEEEPEEPDEPWDEEEDREEDGFEEGPEGPETEEEDDDDAIEHTEL